MVGISKIVYRGVEDIALWVLVRLRQIVSLPPTVLAPVRPLRVQHGTSCHLKLLTLMNEKGWMEKVNIAKIVTKTCLQS